MGFLSGLMGHASEMNGEKVQERYGALLGNRETIQHAYKILRDLLIFTNKRLILIDKQGLTGRKVAYHSLPYRAITHFSVETTGHFDLDAELKIWISGESQPIAREFKKGANIYDVQKTLSEYVLR